MHLPIEIINYICNYVSIKVIFCLSMCDTYLKNAIIANHFYIYCRYVFDNTNQINNVITNLMQNHQYFSDFMHHTQINSATKNYFIMHISKVTHQLLISFHIKKNWTKTFYQTHL